MTAPLLEVQDLRLSIGGRAILNGVHFRMEPGEFRLVIGPNGAGKSTLLKCILGLTTPSQGHVLFQGAPITALSTREMARHIAYVPQFLDLQFNLDVCSFMELSRFAHPPEADLDTRQLIDDCLARTGVLDLKHAYLDELSGGERQRVMIAAALAQQPRLLVLDEPCHSLDPAHRVRLVDLLNDLYRTTGLTILLVTHDWNEFASVHPRILAMKAGQSLFECDAADLPNHLESLFNCAFLHLSGPGAVYSLATSVPRDAAARQD